MKYKSGDKVKIISLKKVMEFPEIKGSEGSGWIGSQTWESPEMDELAGTTRTIHGVFSNHYGMKEDDWSWSDKMIEKLVKAKK